MLLGFIAGKIYEIAIVFADRVLSRGGLRKELIAVGAVTVSIFWVYSTLLYLAVIPFPWPLPRWYGGTEWMLNSGLPLGLSRSSGTDVVALAIFATYPLWFYVGAELGKAGHRVTKGQRIRERTRILRELAQTEFPEGGAIPPSANDVDVMTSLNGLFAKIPPLFDDAITALLFVFDSRFFVLAFRGKWRRFVDLDAQEKGRYLEVWESNSLLISVAQILKMTCSYGYYTRPKVYSVFDYNGPMEPNVPPWYRSGRPEPRLADSESAT